MLFPKRKKANSPEEKIISQRVKHARRVLLVSDLVDWQNSNLKSVAWEHLDSGIPIRDYDDVVLDVSAPALEMRSVGKVNESFEISFPDDRSVKVWSGFDSTLGRTATDDFLTQGGRIFILGEMGFWRPANFGGRYQGAKVAFENFLGIEIVFESSEGQRFEVTEQARDVGLDSFFGLIKGFKQTLKHVSRGVMVDDLQRSIQLPQLECTPYAITRTGKPIAFKLLWPDKACEAYFLPLPDKDVPDAIRSVLKTLLNVDLIDVAPDWIGQFKVPEEDQIDEQIAALTSTIKDAQAQINILNQKRDSARTVTGLLYETGNTLESLVLDAFRELGAMVEASTDRTKEDGWISVQIGGEHLNAVLEIKSTINQQFAVAGIRQLGEWVQRGKNIKHRDCKPIFIGNSSIREPIDTRPGPFVDGFVKSGNQFNAVLLLSTDLFQIVVANRENRLDREGFWISLFKHVGKFDPTPFIE